MHPHRSHTAAATLRSQITRHADLFGVAVATIIGVAAGTTVAASSRVSRRAQTLGVATAAMIGTAASTAAVASGRISRRAAMLGVVGLAIIGIAAGTAASVGGSSAPTTQGGVASSADIMTTDHGDAKIDHAKDGGHSASHTARLAHSYPRPSRAQLLPHGAPSGQISFAPNTSQKRNAAAIVKAGRALKLSPRAMVIAVACSLQETHLHNYGNLGTNNDHDSLGLFQQRPSSGWGSPQQVTNPVHAAQSFYKRLIDVPGWHRMPLTRAIQAVQVSAYPDAYAKWEKLAANLVAGSYAADAAHAASAATHAAQAVTK